MTKETMIHDYQGRIGMFDTAIRNLRESRAKRRNIGTRESLEDANELSFEIKRCSDLRQLCVQVIKDLEDLE